MVAPSPAPPTSPPTDPDAISADEVALYDRQIRLWGMDAQTRMRNSKILLIGIGALANETAKNLVLAGIGSLTLLDNSVVTAGDLCSQFFIQEEHVGMNRAEAAAPAVQQLNPRVAVLVDTSPVLSKDSAFFAQFDITIATELDLDTMIYINTSCRSSSRPFYSAACYGLYGYVFADLIQHTFVIERDKSNIPAVPRTETSTRRITSVTSKRSSDNKTTEFITKEETYTPLSSVVTSPLDPTMRPRKRKAIPQALPCIKALWAFQKTTPAHRRPTWSRPDLSTFTKLATEAVAHLGLPADMLKASFISSFIEGCSAELAPVAAILGGVLAQDVINVLGKREQPLQNILVFDGDMSTAPILALHPPKQEGGNGGGNGGRNGGGGSRWGGDVGVVSLD